MITRSDRVGPPRGNWPRGRVSAGCLLAAGLTLAGCASSPGGGSGRDSEAATRMRVAAAAEASGQMDVALSMYAAAANAAPGDMEAQARFASALIRVGDLPRAEQVLAAALERRPDDPGLLLSLGSVRLQTGAASEALGLFDRVLAR
jgi:Flp pilus assembly protein TadD